MNRVEARALALVNWNGMIYERFWLDRDRRVTALAGDNGAGKTTIMIGAYVVLMPDMGRLRFTNLGASATSGGDRGIWGRLGEPGAPSYAALDFEVPGEGRLIAVVKLERHGEPTVELTPMTIEGLGPNTLLKDLFLSDDGDTEFVVDQQGLRANTTREGGTLRVHDSAGKYFAALYDKGVMPLRMATEEDRTRFNEMLRTSMQGGMSSRILQDLGKFLLMEETRLGDSLLRMRENLDSCRRTRLEVQESQRLEREIHEIYDLGNAMFAAAYLMTRKRAEEYEARLRGAEVETAEARAALVAATKSREATQVRLSFCEAETSRIKGDLEAAKTLVTALKTGLEIMRRIAEYTEEERKAFEEKSLAGVSLSSACIVEEKATLRLSQSQDALNHAVEGLANFQVGLDELQRKVARNRQATRSLATARACLGLTLAPEDLCEHLDQAINELASLDEVRREKERIRDDAERHSSDFAEAIRILKVLAGFFPGDDPPYDVALEALRAHRKRFEEAAALPALKADLEASRAMAEKQKKVIATAGELGIRLGTGQSSAAIVRRRHEETMACLEEARDNRRSEQNTAEAHDARLMALRSEREANEAREPLWRELNKAATRLAEFTGLQLASDSDLSIVRARIKVLHETAAVERDAANARREALLAEARLLAQSGGPFSPELLRIREELGAELYVNRFENLPLAEAARTEALLGERAMALVVADPLASASVLSTRDVTALPEVHLIAESDEIPPADGNVLEMPGEDVAVWTGSTLRVTRLPERPRIGRRAREARIEELEEQAREEAVRVNAADATVFFLDRLVADAETLLKKLEIWLGPSPDEEYERIDHEMADVQAAALEARKRERSLANEISRLKTEETALTEVLADAALLEPPDYASRRQAIEVAISRAHDADARARSEEGVCQTLERLKENLRTLPLEPEGLKTLEAEVAALRARRLRIVEGIEALRDLEGNVEALSWTGYEQVLQKEIEIRPELERQLAQAREDQATAAASFEDAGCLRREADLTDKEVRERYRRIVKDLEEENRRLEELAIGEPSQERIDDAKQIIEEGEYLINELVAEINQEHQKLGAADRDIQAGIVRVETADAVLAKEQGEAGPARQRRDELQSRTHDAGYDTGLFLGSAEELMGIGGSINLGQEAEKLLARLQERAKSARQEANALVLILSRKLREREGESFGMFYFGIWTEVRGWIVKRLPLEISEGDDPREMLMLLKERLASAEAQLLRQESLLRGTGEDLANGIKIRIRQERAKVDRLNRELGDIRFGGIRGIRIRTVPVDEMSQILSGLESGNLQNTLFGDDVPLEEALDMIFEKYGGGKGSAGGHKVLDYREYIHLQVEFQRLESEKWEIADTGKLSTGEAIGVGAALMMVILGAWEGDAVLFRGKRRYGSLRFLFLDEANRLDPRSLGVLFDLCAAIGLQLIVAAPEVSLSEGNITHQIVPTYLADGRRKVQVFSRRQGTPVT